MSTVTPPPNAFRTPRKILFQHCDPAGIVFYARYFELTNSVVEEWFDTEIGVSFADMHLRRGDGVPAVKIEAEFPNASRLGDDLTVHLWVTRIGNASMDLALLAECAAEVRFIVTFTVVHADTHNGRSLPWPDTMRAELSRFLAAPEMETAAC